MEFKGTKGKWDLKTNVHKACNGDQWGWVGLNTCDSKSIGGCSIHWSGQEAKATAQLISKAPELFEMLKVAKSRLGRLRRSMTAHPDCIEGSEFDDLTNIAQELEGEIEALLKEATTI